MTKKNSSPKRIVKDTAGTILFIIFSIIGTILFYTVLVIGVLITVSGFFSSENAGVLISAGLAILAAALLGNLLGNRISYGKWRLSWPSFPGM